MTPNDLHDTLETRLKVDGVSVIDLGFLDTDRVIAACLIDAGSELALIETGPSTCLENLERGVAAAGYDLRDVNRIIVTHIHLDHSGAAGVIARKYPDVRVSAHPVGAPHLIEPERLARSAARIYGDDMNRLWGEIAGVPEDQVDLLQDGETLAVGNRPLRIAFTPGHASHHVVVFDERSGTLFAGDTGGVRMPGSEYVAAPIPPPEFDPDAWEASIATMRAFEPDRIALTHFGVYEDPMWHLDQVMPRVRELVAMGEAAGDEIADITAMTRRFDAFQREKLGDAATDLMMRRLNLANPDVLAAMGLERYLRKRGEVTA
ncbi:MAG: MBL fold metallo-hydrolase [Chloroflexia bacterium]|jgi:glyoxylase-like metal-dependent hydrolase (beta-lactamase superfamily II)|nr:MBL fold metallo-hydrolase [Chloroflexia bacterium]